MARRVLVLLVLAGLTAAVWQLDLRTPGIPLQKVALSALVITLAYLLHSLLQGVLGRRIPDVATQYTMRKATSILATALAAVVVLYVWVEQPQNLVVAYGLLGAGVAIAMQDLLGDFAGGVTILVTRPYRVGDRVDVGGVLGDVVDIGLVNTTLLELQASGGEGRATGALVFVPNRKVLTDNVMNYTKDHSFLWDTIDVPLHYDSDWRHARTVFLEIAREQTEDVREAAEAELGDFMGRYYLTEVDLRPSVRYRLTDDYIVATLRYPTQVRTRAGLRDGLSRRILATIEEDPKLRLGGTTLDITGFPGVEARGGRGGLDPPGGSP